MPKPLLALCLLVFGASALRAEAPMTAAEFEAFVTGRTMDYLAAGTVYGTEEYLPGRRFRWAPVGEDCSSGTWSAEGELICFLHDTGEGPYCWTYRADGARLSARYVADPLDLPAIVVQESPGPLLCDGPEVGV